uniref:Transmembrane protein 131-like n=1 Tax=Nicotiana tabacum TaxID=4097 RepID=A0A1S3XGC6_TOBAC|nr:PREDICTED: transmembrane protein 131-like [Nicotiana tabacum]
MNCKLLITTNDSRTSDIEVACRDVVRLCSGGKFDSSIGHGEYSDEVELGNSRTMSSSSMHSPSEIKAVDTTVADELVLRNWKSQATANGMSVLDESEIVFPVIQVGSHQSQWITVKNPSQKPILVQLVLNSWEIVDECKTSGSHLQPSLSSRIVGNYSIAPRRYGFSLAENAVTEALLHPFGRASFGPILFQPAARCQWKSSALVRNSLSGVEWLPLRGSGGLLSLVLLDEFEPVQNLDFKLNMPTPLNLSSSSVLYNMKDNSHACSLSLSKELHAKNVGDFPLEVKKIEISGTKCGTDGFVINGCKGFSLEPEESIKLVISYHTDFSVATIQRDLELTLATGILVIPMKASLPICVLHFCKKSLFWMKVKKLLFTILLLASLFFLVLWCIIPQFVAFGSHECLPKSGKSYIASADHAGKLSCMHPSDKQSGKFVFSKLNGLLRSIGEGYNCLSNTQKGLEVSTSTKSVAIQSADTNATSKSSNLTVKIGKEKGRRRKKKKNSATALAGVFEVSSSHSGNSTPSSPLSPTSSSTPSRPSPQSTDVDGSAKLSNPFADVGNDQCKKSTHSKFACQKNVSETKATVTYGGKNACFPRQEKPTAPKKLASKPVLLPSATFPSADKSAPRLMCRQPLLASSSIIAPHLRAPGSKPQNQVAVKTDEKMGLEEKFTYDIWGDHLSNLPLVGRSKEVSEMPPHAIENSSSSFFLRGPQTLITNYQQTTVSSDREG